jgi:uncharacterized protein (DUF302 family)
MTGIVTLGSPHDYADTVRRLDAELAARGVPVFARVDHAANAAAVGLSRHRRWSSSCRRMM